MAYTVQSGDTLMDAAFNVTGSLAGIDPMLEINIPDTNAMLDWKSINSKLLMKVPESNFMESYTPQLKTGQVLNTDGLVVYNLDATLGRRFNSSYLDEEKVNLELMGINLLLTA